MQRNMRRRRGSRFVFACKRPPVGSAPHIEIDVDDDGKAGGDPTVRFGMGLLGMLERITALGGGLSMDTSRPSGPRPSRTIPVPPAATRACRDEVCV